MAQIVEVEKKAAQAELEVVDVKRQSKLNLKKEKSTFKELQRALQKEKETREGLEKALEKQIAMGSASPMIGPKESSPRKAMKPTQFRAEASKYIENKDTDGLCSMLCDRATSMQEMGEP